MAPLLLAVATLAVALVVAEAMLAWLHPVRYRKPTARGFDQQWRSLLHRPSAIPGLHYELAPERVGEARGATIVTNRHGMRDDPPMPDDTPGLFRIAVLGDSFTFGYGVEAAEAYPSILERLLRDRPPDDACRYDVLNFGVSGYSTRDEALVLRHKAMAFHPRQVIVGYFLNDPQIEPIQPLQTHFAPVHWWQRFHLTRLASQVKNLWDRKRIANGSFYDYLHAVGRKNWQSVEAAFADMADAAGPDVPVLIVIFPEVPNEGWRAYRYGHLHEQVARSARAAGHGVLDLLDVMRAHDPGDLRLSPTDEHLTPYAHRLVAEAIFDRLFEQGLPCAAPEPPEG